MLRVPSRTGQDVAQTKPPEEQRHKRAAKSQPSAPGTTGIFPAQPFSFPRGPLPDSPAKGCGERALCQCSSCSPAATPSAS